MKIQHFSQQGKRSNNEDSLGTSAALLTVCDGMGGHVSGERASAFVKDALLKVFAKPQPLGKMEIQQELNKIQTDLNQLLEKEPELEKMGTTFTGVFITPDVWYAAHIGDSRIYLFRPSEQKLWHTWDHSLVGELMRTKEITVEAGRFHPMSNRISKAIIAQKDGKPANASIVKIDELKAGDVLLLCSDGVVEAWGDWELVQLFSDESLDFDQKCQKIAEQCAAKSKDNNTAIIAEIGEEDAFGFGSNDELEWTTFAEVEADYDQYVKDNEEVEKEASKPEEKPQTDATNSPVGTRKPLDGTKEPACVYGPPQISKRETPTTIGKSKLRIVTLVAIAAIIALALFLIPKGKRNDAPATNSVESVGKPSKTDAVRQLQGEEAAAYNAIKTIDDCEEYLKKYGTVATPERINTVKKKKSDFEKKAKEEAEAAQKAKDETEKTESDTTGEAPQNEAEDNKTEILKMLQL